MTIKSLLRGILYGIAFFVPGYLVLSNWKVESLYPFIKEFAELPIITELSKDFKTGIEFAGKDFEYFKQRYNNSSDNSHSIIPDFTNKKDWVWQRVEMEEKLAKRIGRRQVGKRQLFLNYIEQYAPYALSEMAHSHIPASITLAQGILETNAGKSYIARHANNHFGIKCYRKRDFGKDGRIDDTDYYHDALAYDCVRITDDNVYDRFHVYQTPALSYRHHTRLLSGSRYNWMIRQYGDKVGEKCQVESHWFGTDTVPYYAAWCIGLKKSGYATSPKYAQKLAYLIETYELWRFDYQLLME